jgi:small subunit ribosomal protein S18
MAATKSKSKSAAKKERRPKRKVCTFCAERQEAIDYKDQTRLRKYVSERGKILPRRISGNCASHQRALTVAVKRARVIALLPFVVQ